MTPANVDLEHLLRLSDDTGLLEHAKGAVPRRSHGYCLDDVARGLVVLARQPDPSPRSVALTDVYLAFVDHAADPSGAFSNRLGYDRRWQDRPGTGDWWGRALWGLGAVAAGPGPERQRRSALDAFSTGCARRSPWLRATAFAALGAGRVLTAVPGHTGARALLADAITMIEAPGPGGWPWPEPRLGYANARIPEALLVAGTALSDDTAVDRALGLLDWLVERQTCDAHLSPVPVGGEGPGDTRPAFDQQPIEVAALADAAVAALEITGAPRWRDVVGQSIGWFEGRNDVGVPVHDPATGGGFDGLTATGPNLNQGAESTIAWLLTSQHRHRAPLRRPEVASVAP